MIQVQNLDGFNWYSRNHQDPSRSLKSKDIEILCSWTTYSKTFISTFAEIHKLTNQIHVTITDDRCRSNEFVENCSSISYYQSLASISTTTIFY